MKRVCRPAICCCNSSMGGAICVWPSSSAIMLNPGIVFVSRIGSLFVPRPSIRRSVFFLDFFLGPLSFSLVIQQYLH
ncbi:uncharacterized protein BO95DRAFT_59332 [Aspergillus brunneoviolaceus CBS 621.78]|uniref:Uncharacterized protein n=1 Tax=Aspergillus brunneoviolaceus CBS 621.78 TaxID=1450534 RepID=A0ACD1GFZ1_9EURO|nr:hypothetical protein BO95DRAFT_59332 [Aspergillus brunneoviolaceus CBS 621.78]RAH48204.1 hypothetical protein BO95DRAFT_59332 [Aspergillus brunneoviolaceus CBS 621.78]